MSDPDLLEMAVRMHQVQLERADRLEAENRRLREQNAAWAVEKAKAWRQVMALRDEIALLRHRRED